MIGIASLGTGVAVLVASTIYTCTTSVARHESVDYLTPEELQVMVRRYNNALRNELGIPDDFEIRFEEKVMMDIELQVKSVPLIPQREGIWDKIRIDLSPSGVVASVSF